MPGVRRTWLRGARVVATMNDAGDELRDASVVVEGRRIVAVGSDAEIRRWLAGESPRAGVKAVDQAIAQGVDQTVDEIIDLSGCVLLPGLVNGHHHLYQTLTRTIGTAGGLGLFDWLKRLYPIWGRMDPEAVYVSARLGLCELLLSGATTVADHLYLFPDGARLDDSIAAARELGVRFHATRGSMSLGESSGGLPPDALVESEDVILRDSLRVIETFQDPAPGAMLRIGLAPCSPFSVSPQLMRQSARLARAHPSVGLHTHLAETLDEERYCLEHFGARPLDYVESLEWLGADVWFAHMVHPNASDIAKLARSRSGVCHCATSNMMLASGIAPVRAMLDQGVRVGLGVDGSASNDGNQMLAEARQAMLLQRVGWPGFESRADRLSAREALRLATRGGAELLNRADAIGQLTPGYCADLVAFRIDGIEHAGAHSDPLAALLTCAPTRAWLSMIDGRIVVRDGQLVGVELEPLVEHHNAISRRMIEG